MTITTWLNDYSAHSTYGRLRKEALKRFPAEQTVRSIKLYHRQVYAYAYHRPKLERVRFGTLAGGALTLLHEPTCRRVFPCLERTHPTR